MMTLSKAEKRQPISGRAIKAAIAELGYLSDTFSWFVLSYLTSNGIVFDAKHYYTLEQIEEKLEGIFGVHCTPLLIERLSLTESLLIQIYSTNARKALSQAWAN